ncbi:hypothetical protein EDL98_00080 [Ornithobacterium rhinotracheale]|uniref:hypothetical protein n=1 Tax=Ornithobacterium rhinotracheale TaxID=28251 RepID=UPI00129C6181|nr:hypothetical protein [Ornithobacterium rhinotracheale]MRJ09487.1 hypothetical protein [Ornithobacterium rhinotracheale]
MKKIVSLSVLGLSVLSFAQIKQGEVNVNGENQIKQGEVTVKRHYEPNVNAAEKIKQTPKVSAPKTKKHSVINYQTKDIEAASEFETTPISAEKLPINQTPPYRNYIRAGYGNNSTLRLNGFVSMPMDEDKSIGLNASYLGTDLNDKTLKDWVNTNQSKINAEAFFNYNLQDAKFTLKAGAGIDKLNLYGIPQDIVATFTEKLDAPQKFTNVYAKAEYDKFNEAYFKMAKADAYYLNNNWGSNELGLLGKTSLNTGDLYEADFFGGLILGAKADANLNYIFTNAEDFYVGALPKTNYLNLGIKPQFVIKNDIVNLLAGANLQYVTESEQKNNKFRIFPAVELKLNTAKEFAIYGGITGGVQMNSYQNFYKENPFISPSFGLQPTINKFEFYGGIMGDIGDNFKYNAKAGLQDLENEYFFIKRQQFKNDPMLYTGHSSEVFPNYNYLNSFITSYDDAKRTYINGSIQYIGVEKLSLGANLLVQAYSLKNLPHAFEKPSISSTINAQYALIGERLLLGADLLFVGKRNSLYQTFITSTHHLSSQKVETPAYLDLNLNANFMLTPRWVLFIESNNLLNNHYERFADYKVQGFNILGGVQYKF